MAESRRKILAMLSERKISVDEAAMLLEKLSSAGPEEPAPQPAPEGPQKVPRYLRVVVDSDDGDKVNVRVPFSLIRTGIRLGSLIPKDAAEAVSDKGIDLSALAQLNEVELAESLSELKVDIEGSDGATVRVFAE
jgi:hypothetical protein